MARYFIFIHLILIVMITYLVTFIGYRVLIEKLEVPAVASPLVESPSNTPQVIPGKVNRSFREYRAIIDRDLFKLTSVVPPPADTDKQVDVNALKKTRLGLKLWGTVAGAAGRSFAVIEETATHKQHLFTTGDRIQTASVKMILREKVVLEVDGRKEILKIEIPTNRMGRGPAQFAHTKSPIAAPGSGSGGGKEVVIQRSRIQDAIKNVNELMKYVRIRPHFTNGQPDGLKLTGVRPGSLFTDIGFKNGDIITGVNGKPIQSVDDALAFYSSLKTANNVNLQIRRRGMAQTIQYRVEDK
jgi:general secretion pathway protein C